MRIVGEIFFKHLLKVIKELCVRACFHLSGGFGRAVCMCPYVPVSQCMLAPEDSISGVVTQATSTLL